MQKLGYTVISCSSQEETHPVRELLMQSPQSKGWQSGRFCDYPQDIILKFHSAVRIRQIQFLSHQYKIASRIEIFVYMPDQNTPFINTEIKYRKLGYLSLDSNEKTSYKSRELKSVYVDSPCIYLKLSFHKNHNNIYNTFNQIGVIALSCFGDELSNLNNKQEPVKEFYNQIQHETQFDNVTLDRLRTLEIAKERAKKNEDYDEAQRLKDAIEKLKTIGVSLRKLAERKQIAIDREDFETAKILKAEMDRLRNAVAPEYLIQRPQPLVYNSNIPYNADQFQPLQQDPPQQQDMWGSKPISKPSNNNFRGGNEDDMSRNRIEEQPLVEQDNTEMNRPIRQSKNQPQFEESKQDKLQQQQFEEQFAFNNRNVNLGNNHDEMQLPAMKNQQNKKPWEMDDAFANGADRGADQDQNSNETEKLSNEGRKLAEPLIPVIGEECAAKIFSKKWQSREEGLKWLEAEAQNPRSINGGDPQALFTAIAGVCASTIGDKVAQVSQASMNLLQAVCNSRNAKPSSNKGETAGYVETCIGMLMEQAGSHVPKVREQAEQSLFALGGVSIVGNTAIIQALQKGTGLKPKIKNSIKHIVARLNIMLEFSKRFSIGKKDVPLEPVMKYAKEQLIHPNAEVRTAAIELIVEAHNQVGEGQIDQYISDLPEQQRDILTDAFQSGGNSGGGKKSAPQVKDSKKTVVTTNIQHQGARGGEEKVGLKKGKGPVSGKSPQQQGKKANDSRMQGSDIMDVCEFCNLQNPQFSEKKNLDIHLWKECPMLLLCPHCAQVVEISTYNTHLLEECKDTMKFRQCPRCKEAVEVNQYNEHVQEKSCAPFKPLHVANRCPLCHTDIDQGPDGWRRHLVVQGCPNNERSVG